MPDTFLEFFAKLQQRQTAAPASRGPPQQGLLTEASRDARAAAAAGPISRPASRFIRPDGAEPNSLAPANGKCARNLEMANNTGTAAPQQDIGSIPWPEIQSASSRLGPQLSALRTEQDQQPHSNRESYSMEHLKRLSMFPPREPFAGSHAKVYCSKTHPQPCQYGCKTCHFCRQRTIDIKTVCSLCEGVNNFYGGPGRGYWCGACLWARVGENIEEVKERADWICPGCRDLCNCSSPNCMRIKRGWFPTQTLWHEARKHGFKSVAHYLVLTHVSAAASAAPIADNSNTARVMPAQRLTGGGVDGTNTAMMPPPPKRQRTLEFVPGQRGREQALEWATQSKLQSEVAAVLEELGGGQGNGASGSNGVVTSALQLLLNSAKAGQGNIRNSAARGIGIGNGLRAGAGGSGPMAVPGGSGFLGILDADMQDEDEDGLPGGGNSTATRAVHRHIGTTAGTAQWMDLGQRGNPSTAPGLLPPRRPPARLRPVAKSPLIVDVPDESVPVPAPDDLLLHQLVGGGGVNDGNNDANTMHPGLPGVEPAARYGGGNGVRSSRGPQLVVPGWGAPRQQQQQQQQRQLQSPVGRQITSPVNIARIATSPALVVSPGANGEHGGRTIDLTSPQLAPTQVQVQDEQAEIEGIELDIATHAEDSNEGVITGMAEAVANAEGGLEVAQQPTAPLPPLGGASTATEVASPAQTTAVSDPPLDPPPPCTDAHTHIAAVAASMPADEFIWNQLCLRASAIVNDLHELFRYHPDSPDYAGPLFGPETDVAIYEAAYDASTEQLRAVLRDAEALTSERVAVPALQQHDTLDGDTVSPSPGILHTYSGLRKAVSLLTYLARLLPAEDVQWRVEKRLLGTEPFVDFSESDMRARAILLHSMLELLATLHRRELSTDDAAAAVSGALACMARDMQIALPVLNAIVSGDPLPEMDFKIGPWKYDAVTRQRRPLEIFSELSALYAMLMNALTAGLQQVMAVCGAIGIKAAAFLTQDVVQALLGADVKLPGTLKRDALGLVCAVLDVASPRHDALVALHLTGAERASRESARRALCSVVEGDLIPTLEILVQRDYRMWGDQRSFMRNEDERDGGEHQAEHVGSEKVEALAQCYAFLVACGRLGWPAVEAKATQPYSYHLFWRQANAAYRHFAVFLLAHVLAHAPDVLSAQIHATSALKVWLQSLVDTGGRQCAWYLTSILATNSGTAPLFAGLSSDALDIRNDNTGAKRSALVAAVGRAMAMSASWRTQIAGVIGDLDAVLVTRKKEIETSAFDPGTAVLKWEATSSDIIVALLQSMATLLAPTANRQPSRDFVVPQLRRLLSRVATWAISSCAAAHAHMARKSTPTSTAFSIGSLASEHTGDREGIVDGDESALRTVGDARQRLQASAFAKLPALLDILVSAGAPDVLESDIELLEPLWIIVAGCIELGSGEIAATPVDTAMFELLGDSLAPTSTSEARDIVPHNDARVYSPRLQLCAYVLTTFVRRYLQRSSLRHASHERAAVNAVRLVRAVLAQPSMRSPSSLEFALSKLLRPMLGVLSPEGGVQPSYGTKAVVYTLLSELVKQHPSLLPALRPPPPAYPATFPTALHAFWMAVCRDALESIASRLPSELAEERLRIAQLDSRARTSAEAPPMLLWPSTQQTLAEASNVLMSVLGRPRDMGAVERVYTRPGGPPPLPALPQALQISATQNALFRPGDFPWRVAENAVDLLRTFACLSTRGAGEQSQQPQQDHLGAQWALACFPAVHHLIAGAGQASKLLHGAYRSFRTALEAALGPECTVAYPLAAPRVPAPAAVAPAQEQRQPNTVTSRNSLAPIPDTISGAAVAPPATAAAPVPAVPCGVPASGPMPPTARPQRVVLHTDQPLTALGALPLEVIAPLTVLLCSVQSKSLKGRPAAICVVKDYSGTGGADASAKLAATDGPVVAALLGMKIEPHGPFPVVRFSQVRLVRRSGGNFVCGLTTVDTTTMEIDPQGSMALALRRTQAPEPAISEEAECSSHPGPLHGHPVPGPFQARHALQSQSTHAMSAAPAAVVKVEKSTSIVQLGQDALQHAHSRLIEMGFSGIAAKGAVMGVMQDRGMGWKKLTLEQLIDAAMHKL